MPVLEIQYIEEDDSLLWQSMIGGSKEAFDRIYSKHIDHLVRYGHSFTSDSKLVDDHLQEIFCRIWEMRAHLKQTNNIRYYLLACFRKELIKDIKKKKRNILMGGIFSDRAIKFIPSIESTIIQRESNEQLHKQLTHVFQKLSSRQKEIIYLKFYNDLSYDEIAQLLDLEKKAVYNAVSKAMVVLRKGIK